MTSVLSYNRTPMSQLFMDEKQGWSGYVEREKYPNKKAVAREILKAYPIPPTPESQFVPLSNAKPALVGRRSKAYHEALGLGSIADSSRETVQKEKPDPIHPSGMMVTDNKHHFVRNHGGIPDIDEGSFRLDIGGLVESPASLSLKDLMDPEKFPQSEVTITLQCSGTRQSEQTQEHRSSEDALVDGPWGEGAIGTAVYRGVSLGKVLEKACGGVLPECQHLEFIGADTYFKKSDVFNYAASVPYQKVRTNEEVLLAWEMNGQSLPKIHGAPLRLVVAGCVGARSCKWVYKINAVTDARLGSDPSQEDSRTGAQSFDEFSIDQTSVLSAIIFPPNQSTVTHYGLIEIKGWAYSGDGNSTVEVSPDGGHVWYVVDQDDMSEKHHHTWRLWKLKVPVDAEGWLEFCVRTRKSLNDMEPTLDCPARTDDHVTPSYHRILLYSINKTKADARGFE